jgi:hypothetical protein
MDHGVNLLQRDGMGEPPGMEDWGKHKPSSSKKTAPGELVLAENEHLSGLGSI